MRGCSYGEDDRPTIGCAVARGVIRSDEHRRAGSFEPIERQARPTNTAAAVALAYPDVGGRTFTSNSSFQNMDGPGMSGLDRRRLLQLATLAILLLTPAAASAQTGASAATETATSL